MDKIEQYRQLIEDVLTEYSQWGTSSVDEDVETQLVFDRERHHYHLWYLGWRNRERVRGAILQLDIRPDGKIWIQYDGTEDGIANILVARGVSKQDIVLAYHAPYKRPYTGFAVA